MGIGVSIFLIAVGAVLAFAVHASLSGIDITVVGVVLMVAGVLGLIADLVIFAPRRRSTTVVDEPVRRERVVRERDVL